MALFALLRARALPVICLPGHRGAELGHFTAVGDAVALVIPDRAGGFDHRTMAAERSRRIRPAARPGSTATPGPSPRGPISLSVHRSLPGSGVSADRHARSREEVTDRLAVLLVSGGTTGFPETHPRTHDDSCRYNATASARLCGLSADDVYLVALPAAHNFPLACLGLLGALSVGATTVFTTDPEPGNRPSRPSTDTASR